MDRDRFTSLIIDSVIALCRNGLLAGDIRRIEGLMGITMQNNDVFLINIKEELQKAVTPESSKTTFGESSNKRKHEEITESDVNGTKYCLQKAKHKTTESHHNTSKNIHIDERSNLPRSDIKDEPSSPIVIPIPSDGDEEEDDGKALGGVSNELLQQSSDMLVEQQGVASLSSLVSVPLDLASMSASPTVMPHSPRMKMEEDIASQAALLSNMIPLEGESLIGSHTGPWHCFVANCDYTSKRKYNLERHIRLVHQGIREKCERCGKRFSDVTKLRVHREMVHGQTEWFGDSNIDNTILSTDQGTSSSHTDNHTDSTVSTADHGDLQKSLKSTCAEY